MKEESSHATRLTLGVKLSLFALFLVAGISLCMAYFLASQTVREREQATEHRVTSMRKLIGVVRGIGLERKVDSTVIKTMVDMADQMDTDLAYVLFLDPTGKLQEGWINNTLLSEAAPDLCKSLAASPDEERLALVSGWHFSDESIRQLRLKLKSPGPDGALLGVAQLGFSTFGAKRRLKEVVTTSLLVAAGAILFGLLGAIWLGRHFSRPVRQVAEAMQALSMGDLGQNLKVSRRDEIGVLAESFNIMAVRLQERQRYLTTLARYVSDQVAERILQEEDELQLDGELRNVTVLFLDIRGFTSLSEHMKPREIVGLLNDYFEIIIDIIFRFDGTINKFIGDSIMAIYGAPRSVDLPELRGVMSGVEIQKAVGAYNRQREQEGKPVAYFGIGLHSGEAIAGNIGSARRLEYTVIGRTVNLAQRIESSAREGQVVVSDSTYLQVQHLVQAEVKEAAFMKGIVEPIPLYQIVGCKVQSIEEARNLITGPYGVRA